MPTDPSVVLFDLDDTLCRYPRSTVDLLAIAFERADADPFFTATEYLAQIPTVTASSPLDLREKCFRAIAEEKGYPVESAERVAANYPERDPTNVEFLPDAEQVLDSLAEHYRLGLVSNGAPDTQRVKLETLDIGDYFEVTVFGTPETGIKPDPEPFDHAVNALDVDRSRVIHVGNSLASDVRGAQAAGIRVTWLRTDDTPRSAVPAEFIIDELAELHHEPHPWSRE